jgi:hypothetical protein
MLAFFYLSGPLTNVLRELEANYSSRERFSPPHFEPAKLKEMLQLRLLRDRDVLISLIYSQLDHDSLATVGLLANLASR